MLKANHTVPALFVLALSAIGAGIYLAPSHKEIALMQMNDFHFSTAFKNFSELHSEGDSSINVLAPLVNLNIYYGDIDKAIDLLDSYIALHPRTVEARKKLAELYKSSQRFDHYCAVLEDMQELAPSAATLRRLQETYAFLGQHAEEMKVLAKLIESDDYQKDESDFYKLASFYRADHQAARALSVITDYIEDSHYHVTMETLMLALQLYQEADKEGRALSMAEAFLRKQPKEENAIMISTIFEARGQFDSGYEVLKPYLPNMENSTDLEQQVADLMLEQHKDDELYEMLSTQRNKNNSLPPSLAVTLTDLAVTRADYDMLETLIRTQNLEKMPEFALLRFADTAYRLKRPDLAQIMQGKLRESYFDEAPVLKVVLGVVADDTPKSMAALAALPRDAIQTPQEKIILAGIYLQHGQRATAFALVDNMSVTDVLESFDAEQYAEIYLDMGAADKAQQALIATRDTGTPEIQNTIDQIMVLLAAGTGDEKYIREKLANYKAGDLWPDAYDFAVHYNHVALALIVADKLYQIDPSEANRLQLAEALMYNSRFVEAINHLQEMVLKNDDARLMYLDAISLWGTQAGGASNMSAHQRAALNAVINAAIKNPNMPLDERHDLAFVLEEIGFYPESESILVALAGNQPYDHEDIQELLGFWSDHPSDVMVKWISARAGGSSGEPQVPWLTFLNDSGYPQVVLDILEDSSELSPGVADQYIEALLLTKDKQRLSATLQEYIDNETSYERLRRLSVIASDEDVDDAAEMGWRKIYALNQNDSEAAKQLGLIDYSANKYEEAEALLKQYLQTNKDDYQVNFAYGEILQQQDRKGEADPYLNRALQQISGIKPKDKPTRVEEAYLLYATEHITESVTLFRQLLAEYPDDKEIRADLAEILTETGKYDEAAALLSQ